MSEELIEPLTNHAPPVEHGSDRSFGIVFAVVFMVIGVLPIFTDGDARVWALSLSGAFLLTAAVRPRLLNPLNRVWARFGMLLNRIVSPVALLIVYTVAVVPTALVLRLFRKDLLRLQTNAQVSSYWVMRTPPVRPDAQMKKQF
jgi:hypothetical protein